MTKLTPTTRFSNRVGDYVRFRPHYPEAAIEYIERALEFLGDEVIADIGSGTGISAEPFLERGYTVFGIEPNDAMRAAAEAGLRRFTTFKSLAGTAESTTLLDASVSAIIAAQAFHWFRVEETKSEFLRILKPGGSCVLLWNERLTDRTQFLSEYEALIRRFSIDYEQVDHRNVDATKLREFYSNGYTEAVFSNVQRVNLEGLIGRLASSSYLPAPESAEYPAMIRDVTELFERSQSGGAVDILYDCKIFIGRMTQA